MDKYESNNFKLFETREEGEASYWSFLWSQESVDNHEDGKGAAQIGPSRLQDFIILVQFIVIIYLSLS